MSRRAIIAGAGIGGLATACALSQAGVDVTLYERTEVLEEFGAGLQLTPNATRVLSRLGILESVRAVSTAPDAVTVLRGSDDAVLMRMALGDAERRWGAPYLAIHRADLQHKLADAVRGLSNAQLLLGSTVAGIAADGDRVSVGLKRGAATIQDSADSADRRRRIAFPRPRASGPRRGRQGGLHRARRVSRDRRVEPRRFSLGST